MPRITVEGSAIEENYIALNVAGEQSHYRIVVDMETDDSVDELRIYRGNDDQPCFRIQLP